MSGRGRGRGRGGSTRSFNREQLNALRVGGNELLPGPVTQPPPLYPLFDRKPVPITQLLELDYMLILRQDFIDHMHMSPSYLKMPENTKMQPQEEIEKLIAQLPCAKVKFDWNFFPSELRPKLIAKRNKTKTHKEIDIESRLSELEKIEETKGTGDVVIKTEVQDEDEDNVDDPEALEDDDEMDDGTDYANNYFDNGEAYEDEDDNLDDGPIY